MDLPDCLIVRNVAFFLAESSFWPAVIAPSRSKRPSPAISDGEMTIRPNLTGFQFAGGHTGGGGSHPMACWRLISEIRRVKLRSPGSQRPALGTVSSVPVYQSDTSSIRHTHTGRNRPSRHYRRAIEKQKRNSGAHRTTRLPIAPRSPAAFAVSTRPSVVDG